MSEAQAGPLDGIRVADFTNVMAGPICTRILADMGAEVIKIEPPEGDHSRTRHPIRNGRSVHYAHINCGKKSVALDLKSKAGKAAAFELCMKSDVVVENWRPGVSARLGLDYKSLSAKKSDIIYCAVSGYGQVGPNAMLPAFASLVEAKSGFSLAQMKLDSADKPQISGLMLGDTLSGVWAFAGIQSALIQRERTGRGAMVDLAMHDSMLFHLIYECHEAQFGASIRRTHVPLRTTDGYIQVPPITERNFQDTARATGHLEWLEDKRFNSVKGRNENWYALLAAIEEWTRTRSTAECEKILMAGGVPCASYRTMTQAMADPHLAVRGAIATLMQVAGGYRLPNVPFQMPGSNTHARDLVADFNQHEQEVLGGILGYTKEQIAACHVEPAKDHE